MARPVALTIAGSDSSGGAGIQADVVTFAGEDVEPRCVVTVVTAQDSLGVRASLVMPATLVASQLDAVLHEGLPAASKTGALGSAEIVRVVVDMAKAGLLPNLVVDPVVAASAGGSLLDAAGTDVLRGELVPFAAVVTPNLDEAGIWIGRELGTGEDVVAAAPALRALGCGAIVVTGGHMAGDPVDVVVTPDTTVWISGARITGADPHGTGCIHSAALCARLAHGDDVVTAATRARRTVETRLRSRESGSVSAETDPPRRQHAQP